MDAASPANIQKIVSLGDKVVSENEELLDKIVAELIKEEEGEDSKSV